MRSPKLSTMGTVPQKGLVKRNDENVLALVGTFVTEGELGAGASTITMQLARNVSFSLERRFLRKFKEMLLALKIEQELSKDEILELYINIVPFGNRRIIRRS